MRAAKKTDWKTEPLPTKRTTLPLDRSFSLDQMQRIRDGLIPEEMEDKWFIYWNEGYLCFHRSWTGYCIYVVLFTHEREVHRMIAADVNRDLEQYSDTNDENDCKMVSYLIDVLLLKQDAIFPCDEPSSEKQALLNWSQVGQAMFGQHPSTSKRSETLGVEAGEATPSRPTPKVVEPMNEPSEKQMSQSDDIFLKSLFYEQLVEHVFISEVLQEAWYRFGQTVEVLRSEVDASGFDVVFECNGILRHVQLKTSKADAKASGQKVNIALAKKPSGCIIWIVRNEDRQTCRMRLSYLFFGGNAGKPLPTLEGFKVAKHTKGNAQGVKNPVLSKRIVLKSRFEKVNDATELVQRLFGVRGPANNKAIEQVEAATDESEVDEI